MGLCGADPAACRFPLKDGPRLQAWLRRMGREHWVPSCHQHLCSEHFTPSCFQWRWGVRYLRPDAVPSIFSRAPPAKVSVGRGVPPLLRDALWGPPSLLPGLVFQSSRRSRSAEKPLAPPPPPAPEAAPGSPEPAGAAAGPVQVVVLAPTSASPEAAATVLLAPVPAAPGAGVSAQSPRAGLRAALGALQRRVRRLQRRHERHQAQLRALEQLAQQLRSDSARARRGPPRVVSARGRRAFPALGTGGEAQWQSADPQAQPAASQGKAKSGQCNAAKNCWSEMSDSCCLMSDTLESSSYPPVTGTY
jgi:hypothetical protein